MEARLLLSRGHWPLIALATAAFALALFALAGTASAVDDDLVIAAPENPPFISADQGDMQRISGQEGTNDGTFSPPPVYITGSGSMGPNSPPFGTNVDISPNVNNQNYPQVAVAPSGRIYVAFQNWTGTSWDIYVLWSDNDGATWVQYAVATQAYDEMYPSINVALDPLSSVEHVNVFYRQSSVANQIRWVHSDNGATWSSFSWAPAFGGGIVLNNYRFSSQSSFGQLSYAAFDVQDVGTGGGVYTLFWMYSTDHFESAGSLGATTFRGSFHLGDQWMKPQVILNETLYNQDAADFAVDGCVVFAMEESDPSLTFAAGDGSSDISYIDPNLNGGSDPTCPTYYFFFTSDIGALGGVDDFDPDMVDLGGTSGVAYAFTFDDTDASALAVRVPGDGFLYLELLGSTVGSDHRFPQLFSSNGLVLAGFLRNDTIASFAWSGDFGDNWLPAQSWNPPGLVSDNGGTAAGGFHSIVVAYTDRLHMIWTDNRDGDNDTYYATMASSHFYRITRSPEISDVRINGTWYPAPYVALYQTGDFFEVSVSSPTPDPTDPFNIRYIFSAWTDAGAMTHTVVVGSTDLTITALFDVQYYLTLNTNAGTVLPGSGWYNASDVVNIQLLLPPNVPGCLRYTFREWRSNGNPGGYDGTNNPATITMLAPLEETAVVDREFYVSVVSPYGTPSGTNWYLEFATATVSVNTPVAGAPGTRYNFDFWSGSGTGSYDGLSNPIGITVLGCITETAVWQTEYQLIQTAVVGTVQPGTSWHPAGRVLNITAEAPAVVAGERWVWQGWTGPGNPVGNPASVTMDAAKTYAANWQRQWYLGTSINLGTITCTPGPCGWYNAGASVQIQATSPAPGVGQRYTFAGWTGTGTGSYSGTNLATTLTMNAFITETARFISEFQLTINTNFGTVTPSSGWFADGSTVTLAALPPGSTNTERYVPSVTPALWTGGGTGSYTGGNNPATITFTGAPITEVATWVHEYYLDVRVDAGTFVCLPAGSPGPCGWYAAGTAVTVQATPPATGAGEQYIFIGWAGTGTGSYTGTANPASVTMSVGIIQAGDFRHEYLITLTANRPGVGLSPPNGWYEAGTLVTLASTSPTTQPGERYVFTAWSGSPAITGNPVVITLDSPRSYEARWDHEYSVTATTNFGTASCTPGPCGWYAAGTSVTLGAIPPPGSSVERYGWVGWIGSGAGNYTGSATAPAVVANAPLTESAVFSHEFYLTVTSPYGSPQGEGWYADGTTAVASVTSPVTVSSDTRRLLSAWSGDAFGSAAVVSVLMDAPKTVTAAWATQFLLAVNSPYGNPTGAGWYDSGFSAGFSVIGQQYAADDDRWTFTAWTGDSSATTPAATVVMGAPRTVTATWVRELLLTVSSPYATASGTGWFVQGTSASFSVTPTAVSLSPGMRQSFESWTGDSTSTTPSASILMDTPKSVTAGWQLQFQLTVATPQSSVSCVPSPCDWYDAGTDVTMTLQSSVVTGSGDRWRFTGWTGTTTSASLAVPFRMDEPHDYTAVWVQEFRLTVTFTPSGITPPVYVDGSGSAVPDAADIWLSAGSPHRITVLRTFTSGGTYSFVRCRDGTTEQATSAPEATVTVTLTALKVLAVEYSAVADTDRDLLPDTWENLFFNNLGTNRTAFEDPDNDGANNLQEFESGTDPTIPEATSFVDSLFANPIMLILVLVLAVALILLAVMYKRKSRPVQVVEEAEEPPGLAAAQDVPFAPGPEAPAPAAVPPPPPPAAAPAPAPVPAPSPVAPASAAAASTVECTVCGIINDANKDTCAVCGEKLPKVTSDSPAKLEKLQAAYRAGRITKEQYEANLRKLQGT